MFIYRKVDISVEYFSNFVFVKKSSPIILSSFLKLQIKKTAMRHFFFKPLIYILPLLFSINLNGITTAQLELQKRYELSCLQPSDINEHIDTLRCLAKECSSVVEIGMRNMVSTWGLLQGLSENSLDSRSYLGIDIALPPLETLNLARRLAKENGISFSFLQTNDMNVDIDFTELLFIDSLHTYCHLTYELEKFAPQIRKYIAMHDTSWGNIDDPQYQGDYSEYPLEYDRSKRGLWLAIEDFLKRHPEWILNERHLNNYGFTILKRINF